MNNVKINGKNYVNQKHCSYRPEIQCNCHKDSPQLQTLGQQEIFASLQRNKICLKIPRIFNRENVFSIFTKNLVIVAMRKEKAFYHISMYLQNKNVLEYAQFAQSGPNFMVPDIEGLPNILIQEDQTEYLLSSSTQ